MIVKFDGVDIKESRDLPKVVASAPVGKDVNVIVMRQGKELTKSVKLGRLEDNEKMASLDTKAPETSKAQPPMPVEKAFGMEFSSLSSTSRQKFSIGESVAAGVVVSDVDPDLPAAEKNIQPGEVILEINQIPVKDPSDVASKIKALKDTGKKSALFLISNTHGEVRFVALAMQ